MMKFTHARMDSVLHKSVAYIRCDWLLTFVRVQNYVHMLGHHDKHAHLPSNVNEEIF